MTGLWHELQSRIGSKVLTIGAFRNTFLGRLPVLYDASLRPYERSMHGPLSPYS